MFKILFIWLLFSLMTSSYGQSKSDEAASSLISTLQTSKLDTNRIKLLFQLSDFYLNKRDYESAFIYLQQAVRTADSIQLANWRYAAYERLGKYYFTKGNSEQGKECFIKIIDDLNGLGNKIAEVAVWEGLAKLISERDTSGITRINCLEKIVLLNRHLSDKEKEIDALKRIADVHLISGQLDTAEAQLLDVLKEYKAINYSNLHYTYDLLSVTYRYKGDFNEALSYALKAVQSMDSARDYDSASAVVFYSRLANMYRELGQPQNSVKWYWKVFQNRKYAGPVNLYMFRDAGFLARELIKLDKAKEALAFIRDVASKNKPNGIYAKASLVSTLAYCYHALNRKDLAEKNYLNLINLTNDLERDNEVTADATYEVGQYFLDRHQYVKASLYFQKALDVFPGINSPSTVKDIHLKLYNIDSAVGDYLPAINHLRKFQAINDSIFNESKSRQIEELQVQYETAQREKDIELLNNQNQLQQIKVGQANRTRNITLGGTALLLVIVGLLYNSYRMKQRANKKLEVHQIEIDEQNLSLRHLVKEKEWLLKEIHHRVKNNLQIVMSLLNSQSVYIENDAALTAIHDSQHRVQAMSLIHQKLYSTENVSSIDIPSYIRELASYLRDSFDTAQRLRFQFNISPLELDVSQAVPLGLILNEAITNSIKYAFPCDRDGVITISLSNTSSNHYLLSISDNGIGMPTQFVNRKPGSLGMSLMAGLAEDLEGSFSIENNMGTEIKITFVHDLSIRRPDMLVSSFVTRE